MACRGDNFIVVFEYKTGEQGVYLKQKLRFKVGDWPRHFKVSNDGTIYVACQYANMLERFKWQGEGIIQFGGYAIKSVSCIAF